MHEVIRLNISNFVNPSADTAPGDDVKSTIVDLNDDNGSCRLNSEHGERVNRNKDASTNQTYHEQFCKSPSRRRTWR